MLVIYIDMKCRQCGKDTEIKAFATFRNRKGEVRRRGVCIDCRENMQQTILKSYRLGENNTIKKQK